MDYRSGAHEICNSVPSSTASTCKVAPLAMDSPTQNNAANRSIHARPAGHHLLRPIFANAMVAVVMVAALVHEDLGKNFCAVQHSSVKQQLHSAVTHSGVKP